MNSSLKDTQLFKKMEHYNKQSEFTLISYFDKEWRKVIEKVLKNYLNTTDKYFEDIDYKKIDLYSSYTDARSEKYIEILCKIYIDSIVKIIDNPSK